jgi:lipoate---protein ligase
MSGFIEPRPDLIATNPGGPDDPLGESVLDPGQPWLRVFEPADVRIVIGRHQDPEREVRCDRAREDGIPIHRRVAGGGAVVLAPGMVVVAARLRNTHVGTTSYLELVNAALAPAVASVAGVTPTTRGLGDLALPGDDGEMRKILGASMRQNARLVAYLGVFLVSDATSAMERYLPEPSRAPDYRGGRGHAAFCTHLARFGARTRDLISAVRASCAARLAERALA